MPILGVMIGVLSGFGGTAIVLKSQALSVKVKPFIDAARVAGGSNMHIIFRHVVPNVLPLSFLYMAGFFFVGRAMDEVINPRLRNR